MGRIHTNLKSLSENAGILKTLDNGNEIILVHSDLPLMVIVTHEKYLKLLDELHAYRVTSGKVIPSPNASSLPSDQELLDAAQDLLSKI